MYKFYTIPASIKFNPPKYLFYLNYIIILTPTTLHIYGPNALLLIQVKFRAIHMLPTSILCHITIGNRLYSNIVITIE